MITVLIIVLSIIAIVGIALAIYAWNNTTYTERNAKAVQSAGYNTHTKTVSSGTTMSYAEGPNNGPPLLLIHGQGSANTSYNRVLPDLAKHFHVYTIDVAGHGNSSRTPERYTIGAIGKDMTEFINKTIKEPTYLTGHSSGGLIAAWLAAEQPKLVKATLFEDPPFFSTDKDRMPQQFNYHDLAKPSHDFLQQTEQKDFASFYMQNNAWIKYFGNGTKNIAAYAVSYRQKHPNQAINLWFFPPNTNETYANMHQFDPRFADTFYDYSWFENLDQAQLLKKVSQPSILIHANWRMTEAGVLEGAMKGDDATKACDLMQHCRIERVKTGHNFHFEDPKKFVELMRSLAD